MKQAPEVITSKWLREQICKGQRIFPSRIRKVWITEVSKGFPEFVIRNLTDQEWESGQFANEDTQIICSR